MCKSVKYFIFVKLIQLQRLVLLCCSCQHFHKTLTPKLILLQNLIQSLKTDSKKLKALSETLHADPVVD